MSITIAEALQNLPILSSARLVAGAGGLNHPICWTHIVDDADIVGEVSEGLLVFTTAFAFKDNPKILMNLIPCLAGMNLAGIVIAIGKYIQALPPGMSELADQLNFPVLTLPYDVQIVEVTKAIHEAILKKQYELIEKSQDIHRVLTQIVVEGERLDSLADRLAHILNRSVSIEDPSLAVLASASLEVVDELRRKSIETGRTPPEAVAHFQKIGLFERMKRDPKPCRVDPVPELGMRFERIVTPILISSHLFGFIWIIAEGGNLADLDYLAIERAANIAGLIISRDQAIDDASQRAKSSLFESLMDPYNTNNGTSLTELLRNFGLQGNYQIIVVDEIPFNPTSNLRLASRFVEDRLQSHRVQAPVIEWCHHIVILLASNSPLRCKEVADDLIDSGKDYGFRLIAGISAPSAEPVEARKCYQEALNALQVGTALSREGGVWEYSLLGFWNYLHGLSKEVRSKDQYYQIVKKIDQYDRETGADLLTTLEIYLDNSQNITRAARQLYIHRNTLCQRLERIHSLWYLDIDDCHTSLSIHLAIKNWRLNPEK
jgi:purine catabolism regulator